MGLRKRRADCAEQVRGGLHGLATWGFTRVHKHLEFDIKTSIGDESLNIVYLEPQTEHTCCNIPMLKKMRRLDKQCDNTSTVLELLYLQCHRGVEVCHLISLTSRSRTQGRISQLTRPMKACPTAAESPLHQDRAWRPRPASAIARSFSLQVQYLRTTSSIQHLTLSLIAVT